jgi:hypothetical protein
MAWQRDMTTRARRAPAAPVLRVVRVRDVVRALHACFVDVVHAPESRFQLTFTFGAQVVNRVPRLRVSACRDSARQ